MNLQAREINPRKPVKKNTGGRPAGFLGLVTVLELLSMGAVLFLVVNYQISLKDDIARLNRQATQVRKEIDRYDREIENLKLRTENLSRWSYVRNKLRQYNLVLTMPAPGQIKQLVIVRDQPTLAQGKEKGSLMLSQR